MLTLSVSVLAWSCLIVLAVFTVLIKAEYTGIELLVDGKPFNDDVLYKPVGSSGTFVRCLECDTNVTPNWFKSDIKITSCHESDAQSMICANSKNNIGDLRFPFFIHPHRGNYTCSNHGNHKTLIIDVLEIPTITIHPTSVLTASNVVNSTLNCEGTSKGMLTYQWETSNVDGRPWMKIGDDKRLVVRSPERSQHYRCIVSNEAGIVRSNIATVTTLKITAQPVNPVTALEDVNLVCLSSVTDGVRYSWNRVNGGIPYKSRGRNSSVLMIPRAIPNDEGVYYCKASKNGISAESNKIVVKVNDQLGINVVPKNLITSKGKTIQFIAKASGANKPHFVYQWKKKDSAGLVSKVSGVNEAVLTIPDVVESDEGKYYCIVTNEWRRSLRSDDVALTIHGSPIIRSISNITSPPTITTHPFSQLVTARMTFTLNCEATGEGSITYQWQTRRANGGQWTNVNNSDSMRLNVSNLMEPQQYRCVASNEVGETISNVSTVTILKIIDVATHLNRLRYPGNSITFTCTSSVSNVMFSWTHDGRPITRPNTQTTANRVGSLKITNIRNADKGRYLCTVTSGSLSVTAHINRLIVYGAPAIVIYPRNRDVYVPKGSSVTYQCRVSGQYPLTYSWEQTIGNSWITVKNNTVLYTTNVTLDVGQYVYRCRVTNNGGPVVSKNITVNVYGPPNITVHPSSQLIITNATLHCEGIGNGSIRYQWEMSSTSEGPWVQINDGNGSNLVVNSVSQSQHYRCVVANQAGIAISSVATVNVLKITTHPQDKLVAVNSTVIFTCTSSTSSNITFSWTRNGVSINHSSLTTDGTSILTITGVSNGDTGSYMCTISSGSVSVMSNTATLTVYGPPVVTYQPTSSNDVPVGRSITLTCQANGLGTLVYSWESSSDSSWITVSNDNTTSYTTDTTLAIGQYMYRCRVSNEAGSVVSNIATVNVYGPPTINNPLIDQVIEVNKRVTLDCKASGDGTITYQWQQFSNGSWIDIIDRNNAEYTTDILTQSSQFRCVVINEAGVTTSNVIILVLGIIIHPEDKVIPVRSTVNLVCTSSLSSNVTFSWTHNERAISESSSTGDTSILTITNVRHRDAGSYKCTVSSGSVSVMSNPATLTVYGIPVITDQSTDDNVIMGRSIILTCRASGLGTLLYSWERSSGSSWTTVGNDNTTSYTTDATLAIGQYMYRCRVSNEAGSVVSNIATVNVYGPPVILDHPKSNVVPLRGRIVLTCRADGIGTLTYSWERSSGSSWTTVSNDNTTSFTTDTTLAIGQYMYRCRVSNEAGSVVSNIATVNVYERSSPPNNLTITDINVNSFELIWFPPTHPRGRIDHYIVHYNQFELTVKVADFNGTFTLGNLSPYTEYNIHLTAVKITQATGESLEGEESPVVGERTLAGEPIIAALSREAENELILNPTSVGIETFSIDLPVISTHNGPFSHLYIIVALSDHVITDVKSISTEELLKQSTYMFPLFYVTAVVNASQFMMDRRMMYVLGAGDNTTDTEGHMFHNREVKAGFTYFFRVFSINSTSENEISTTSETKTISAQPQNSGNTDGSGITNLSSLIIAVMAALLLALIIYAIIMSVWVFISRKQKKKSMETTDGNDQRPIALKPIKTHKSETMSLSYNEEDNLENPAYVSIISKHPTITNTAKGLKSRASTVINKETANQTTSEEMENSGYATISPKDIQSPPDASITNYQYAHSSEHHYETIQ